MKKAKAKKTPMEVALDGLVRDVSKTARLHERERIAKIVEEGRDSLSTAWEATFNRILKRIRGR